MTPQEQFSEKNICFACNSDAKLKPKIRFFQNFMKVSISLLPDSEFITDLIIASVFFSVAEVTEAEELRNI